MPNFFYPDQNNQKQGPVSEQQLKALAAQGVINPSTPLITDGGHRGTAGQIPGLFPAAPPPFAPLTQAAPVPAANLFCTNCGNPVSVQAVACMSCGAQPVGHRKFCRQCGTGLNPEQVICVKCGSAIGSVSVPSGSSRGNISVKATIPLSKTLNTYFMWNWICLAAGIPTCGFSSLISLIFLFRLLDQLWKVIPADIARTTPGKAVNFSLIPIFNFYWIFVAFWGLAIDMNKTLQRRGIQYQVNESMGLIFCIIQPCIVILWGISAAIPIVGILCLAAELTSIVVEILFLNSAKNGAIALLEQGQ